MPGELRSAILHSCRSTYLANNLMFHSCEKQCASSFMFLWLVLVGAFVFSEAEGRFPASLAHFYLPASLPPCMYIFSTYLGGFSTYFYIFLLLHIWAKKCTYFYIPIEHTRALQAIWIVRYLTYLIRRWRIGKQSWINGISMVAGPRGRRAPLTQHTVPPRFRRSASRVTGDSLGCTIVKACSPQR